MRLLALLLLACSVPLFGQSRQLSFDEASVVLLRSEAVQKELGITSTQKAGIQAEMRRNSSAVRQIYSREPKSQAEVSALNGAIQREVTTFTARLLNSLTTPQKTRLRQLALQFFGPFAMLSPDIAKELGVTPAQTAKIRKVQEPLQKMARDLYMKRQTQIQGVPQPKNMDDLKAKADYQKRVQALAESFRRADQRALDSAKNRAEANALKALTPRQRTQWSALLGRKFTFPKSL